MKKIILAPLILVSLIFTNSSCKKEHDKEEEKSTVIINVNLESNTSYQTNLGELVKPHAFKIKEQAMHFNTSEAIFNADLKNIIYKYSPSNDYVGTDEVSIVVEKGKHQECGEHQEGEQHKDGKGKDRHGKHKKQRHHDDDDGDDDDKENGTTYIIKFNIVSSKPVQKNISIHK